MTVLEICGWCGVAFERPSGYLGDVCPGCKRAEVAEQERDDLTRTLEQYEHLLAESEGYTTHLRTALFKEEEEAQRLKARLEQVMRERDEARNSVRLRNEVIDEHEERSERLERERDEARNKVQEYHDFAEEHLKQREAAEAELEQETYRAKIAEDAIEAFREQADLQEDRAEVAEAKLAEQAAEIERLRDVLKQLERDLQVRTLEGDLRPAMLHTVRSALASPSSERGAA